MKTGVNPPEEVDKEALNAMIAEAEKVIKETEDSSIYTEESWNSLKSSLVAAKAAGDNPEVTQEEVNARTAELKSAIEGLTLKGPDKTALRAVYDEAMKKVESEYTAETWGAFAAARDKAAAVLADDNATAEEIKEAKEALLAASAGLKAVEQKGEVNKDALKEAVEKASKLKKEDYTAASWKPFETALSNAQKALDDEDATEEQVAAALKELENAQKALKKAGKKPNTNTNTEGSKKPSTSGGAKTGDDTPIGIIAGIAAFALAVMAGIGTILYRRTKKTE